jgi:hypothetical protein
VRPQCQSIKCPGRGSRYGGGGPARASSEAGLTRGGVQPPNEAEPHPRGRLSLERSGTSPKGASNPQVKRTSPEGASSPRARRGFISAVLCPSSEAEFRLRVVGPTVLVGRWGHLGRDYVARVLGLRICLCFAFYERKWVFPGFLGDPYGCPRNFLCFNLIYHCLWSNA